MNSSGSPTETSVLETARRDGAPAVSSVMPPAQADATTRDPTKNEWKRIWEPPAGQPVQERCQPHHDRIASRYGRLSPGTRGQLFRDDGYKCLCRQKEWPCAQRS